MNILIVAFTSFLSWGIVSGIIFSARDMSRGTLTVISYTASICVFALVYGVYFKYTTNTLSPFEVMVISMLVYFLLEAVFWGFLYTGSENYLTFIDWIVPVFLTASTLYLVGIWSV